MDFPFPLAVGVAAGLIAGVTDVWKFKISNYLTLPLLISGLLYHSMDSDPTHYLYLGFWGSLLGAFFGFAIMVGFYILGGMGAGDVKLMAGLGAWLGLKVTFLVFMASGLAAGIYAVILIIAYGKFREKLRRIQIIWLRFWAMGRHLGMTDQVHEDVDRADRRQRLIPFAAMIAIGLLALLAVWFYRIHIAD